MKKIVDLRLPAQDAADTSYVRDAAIQKLRVRPEDVTGVAVRRRSLDARSRPPVVALSVEVAVGEPLSQQPAVLSAISPISLNQAPVIIVGAGPAGYFAALQLLQLGLKPLILERGKDVQSRRRDLKAIQQHGVVNPNSNYCFGEGGAGTYSDGKLYTRSTKRGDVRRVLTLLVEHGASDDILVESHPHIGSNRLPHVVATIRESILRLGGEIRFDSPVTDLILQKSRDTQQVCGVIVDEREQIQGRGVILATGHSARDIFKLLHRHQIEIEAKPFALGVRIEHPQKLIDDLQYGCPRGELLPAAAYRLVTQVQQRGVYSFCMCPGGLIVPASTAPGEIVVNGMSMSRRDSRFANSGMVVEVNDEDFSLTTDDTPLRAMIYQSQVEQQVFQHGDGTSQAAPAQRMVDFCEEKLSSTLPATSYLPGLVSRPLHQILPHRISSHLSQAFRQFSRSMPRYYTNDAVLVATESRTSSPVRIPRDPQSLMHPQIAGLFPAGEGAGYAGGIISAALDGERCAHAAAIYLGSHKGMSSWATP